MMSTSICLGYMSSAVGPQVTYPAGSTVLRYGFRFERPSAPSTHRTIAVRAHTSPELATLADGFSISAPFAVLSGALLTVSSGHAGRGGVPEQRALHATMQRLPHPSASDYSMLFSWLTGKSLSTICLCRSTGRGIGCCCEIILLCTAHFRDCVNAQQEPTKV